MLSAATTRRFSSSEASTVIANRFPFQFILSYLIFTSTVNLGTSTDVVIRPLDSNLFLLSFQSGNPTGLTAFFYSGEQYQEFQLHRAASVTPSGPRQNDNLLAIGGTKPNFLRVCACARFGSHPQQKKMPSWQVCIQKIQISACSSDLFTNTVKLLDLSRVSTVLLCKMSQATTLSAASGKENNAHVDFH
eukprot:g4141.t1